MKIFAAVSKEGFGGRFDTGSLVLEGLTAMEYAGYESWGIASQVDSGGFRVEKGIGRLDQTVKFVDSPISLGHLRWATEAPVTLDNAHPQTGCHQDPEGFYRLVIAHNGIIRNHNDLRAQTAATHKYRSQTDSEVIAHLLEDGMNAAIRQGSTSLADLYEANYSGWPASLLKEAATKTALQGENNAFVAAQKNCLLAVNVSAPYLMVGETRGVWLVSSDPAALRAHTNRALFIEAGQMVSIKEGRLSQYSLHPYHPVTQRSRYLS